MSVPVKLKSRLKTIKNLNSIFNALQVITTARMQKVRAVHNASLNYMGALKDVAGEIDLSRFRHPEPEKKTLAIVMSSNRGLCGGFNQGIFYRVNSFMAEQAGSGARTEYIIFGRRAHEHVRSKNGIIRNVFVKDDVDPAQFFVLAKAIIDEFMSGKISDAWVISNRFKSVMKQEALAHHLIPAKGSADNDTSNFILEPDPERLGNKLFEMLIGAELFHLYIDSQIGELSARLFTLKGAIENSKELINNLAIDLNKIRQQSITRDLLEIISSSECLNRGRCN